MNETDLQAKTIAVVKELGGEAHKMSNRFLVGVVDLFVKFPGCPSWIVEAKLERPGPRTASVEAAVTAQQARFMGKYHAVEEPAFVLLFVEFPRAPGKFRGARQEKGVVMRRWPCELVFVTAAIPRHAEWRDGIIQELARCRGETQYG